MAEQIGAVLRIPLDQVEPGRNHRGEVGDVSELAASMRVLGQTHPAIVVERDAGRYELVDGHRRHAAAILAGRAHLDVIARPADLSPEQLVAWQLSVQSQTLRFAPMAEARALHELMFTHGWSRERIAHTVGKPPGWVRDRISLVHLEPREQRDLDAGRMSIAEGLRRLRDRRAQRDGRQPAPPRPATPRQSAAQSAFQAGLTAPSRPASRPSADVCPTCHQPWVAA